MAVIAVESAVKYSFVPKRNMQTAVIAVESAVKYSFVPKGHMQTRLKSQYNAELTLSPRLCVKPLITAITAIVNSKWHSLCFISYYCYYFGYAVRSEKYVRWLRGWRNAVSIPRSLSLKAKITHFNLLHKNE